MLNKTNTEVVSPLPAVTPGILFSKARSAVAAANITALCDLARGLPTFFRQQITLQEAKEKTKDALDKREETFLELIRTQIYAHKGHPYHRLLNHAGCDFSDFRSSVRKYGIEKVLQQLAIEGVYLSSDEFKGKTSVVRGLETFRVHPSDFEPRGLGSGFAIQSSGTKNRPVRSFISLDWLAARAWAMGVFFSDHDLLSRPHALYDAILPGSAVNHLLINARLGRPTERWFARRIPFNTSLAGVYHRMATSLIVLTGKWFGPGLPRPEFTSIEDLRPIVRWIEEKRREGVNSQITTIVSSAVRIAQTARHMGVSLEGAKFVVSGEPFTEAKRDVIEQAGSFAVSHYAYGGGINIGFACPNPAHVDDIHINQHLLALIAHPTPLPQRGERIQPLLCSTIRPEAPRVLLNVESGDYGTLTERTCGCTLEALGLSLHLSQIRSYEKFTSEGMNYFYGDLFEFLEITLPREFGGGPGDYQLVEEEDKQGLTRLTLVVHPALQPLDEAKLLTRLRESLGQGPKESRFVSRFWHETGTLRIRRAIPHASARGKILPLHLKRGNG